MPYIPPWFHQGWGWFIDQLKRLGRIGPIYWNQKLHFIQRFLLSNHTYHTPHQPHQCHISRQDFTVGSDQLKRLVSPVERSGPEGRSEWSDPTIRRDSNGQPGWDECPVKWYDNWLPHVKWFQNSSECETNLGPVNNWDQKLNIFLKISSILFTYLCGGSHICPWILVTSIPWPPD